MRRQGLVEKAWQDVKKAFEIAIEERSELRDVLPLRQTDLSEDMAMQLGKAEWIPARGPHRTRSAQTIHELRSTLSCPVDGLSSAQSLKRIADWGAVICKRENTVLGKMLGTPRTKKTWNAGGIRAAREELERHWIADDLLLVAREDGVRKGMVEALGTNGKVITVPGIEPRGLVFPKAAAWLLEYEKLNLEWDINDDVDRVVLIANLRVQLLAPEQEWHIELA